MMSTMKNGARRLIERVRLGNLASLKAFALVRPVPAAALDDPGVHRFAHAKCV